MSILIKEMEMPRGCYECPCEYDGWCHATEILDEDGEWIHPTINDPYTKRQEWCPLIELPSDDVVERKRGKWKYQTMVHESGIKANGVECSICGATYNLSITLPDMMVEALNFCPNCGARMVEDGRT